ncbi:MAG: BRO-N domain-containing protein [Sarcina sp.]
MDNLNFEKENLRKIWRGEYCYIGKQVATVFEHENPSKAVSRAIKAENIIKGIEYDTLSGSDLKEFKFKFDNEVYDISRAPRLVIFYERGVDKLIKYLGKTLYEDYRVSIEGVDYNTLGKEENILINKFEDKEIHTCIINGRPCWIAVEIGEALGYSDASKAIRQCILSEEYKNGKEYDVLYGNEIKRVIQPMGVKVTGYEKHISNLTVFYKTGLLGFINYSKMPIGKVFREWLREEVFEELIDMKIGDTISESKFSVKVENISEEKGYVNETMDNLSEIITLVENVDRIVDEGEPIKVAYLERLLKRI